MEERLKELEQRLARAEEVLAALGSHLAIVPEGGGIAIRAPVRIVDGDGKAVAEVLPGEYGAALQILNRQGERVMVLDAIATGGSISVCHRGGKPVILLFADEAGGDFTVYDRDGEIQYSSP